MIKEYKKKDGSKAYLTQVYLGMDPVTGKKKSTTRRGFATKKEAEVMEARLKVNSADGVHTTKKKQRYRFSDVYELWLQQHEREVKPGSYGTTKRYAELHVLPYFGNLFIEKIDVAFCQKSPEQMDRLLQKRKVSKTDCFRNIELCFIDGDHRHKSNEGVKTSATKKGTVFTAGGKLPRFRRTEIFPEMLRGLR